MPMELVLLGCQGRLFFATIEIITCPSQELRRVKVLKKAGTGCHILWTNGHTISQYWKIGGSEQKSPIFENYARRIN